MSANIYEGMADAHHLVRSAQARAVVAFRLTREQLIAFPRPGWTRHFPIGGSMRAAELLVSACGVDIRYRRPGGSTATQWHSLAHKYG
jgi:hypothetical protein